MLKRNLIICVLVVIATSVHGETVKLKTEFQDSRPKTIRNSDGTFGGLAVELMNLIEKNSNYSFVLPKDFTPTARIERNLEYGDMDIHMGFGKTDEREKKIVFGEKLYDLKFVMISNKSDSVQINTVDDVKKLGDKGVVLAILGTNTVEYLKKDLGLTVDDSGKDILINLEKLSKNRGRFFVYNNLAVNYEMNQPKYKDKFRIQPVPLEKFEHYILFSKKVPKTVVDGVNATIKKLKKSGEWDKVTSKYLK
jgi:polar amino acid transport system substrate-binding protein